MDECCRDLSAEQVNLEEDMVCFFFLVDQDFHVLYFMNTHDS